MNNPFRSIHETTDAGPGHARQLAAAFLAVRVDDDPNASRENFMQLAVALRAVGHLEGNMVVLFRYLTGVHFEGWQNEDLDFEAHNIGRLQNKARAYEEWAGPLRVKR